MPPITGLNPRSDPMAKKPSDQVFELRFSLQDYERDMFTSAIGAYQFNRIAEPVVKLMNDVTGMAVFLSIVAATGLAGVAFTFVYPGLTELTIGGLVEAFWLQRMQAHETMREETGVTGPAAGQTGTEFWSGIVYNLMNPNWSWFEPPPQEP